MTQPQPQRMRWRDNPYAVELGFDYYLTLIESRLKGTDVSLVQGLRRFYREELSIDLRETQTRGLMHRGVRFLEIMCKAYLRPNFCPT